jgi:hypothetical protein
LLLLQGAAAATLAWVIARRFAGHEDPFFAPIAAVVALSFARGERGLSAVRMVGGVAIGITAGELTVLVLGSGFLSLGLATFIAAVAVHTLGAGNRLMRNQAASAAILTVVVAGGEAGFQRLIDVLIGAGVALVFTQLVFSPEPVAFVRRAEADALTSMANGLRLTAAALEHGEGDLPEVAVEQLRSVRDHLVELGRVRMAGTRVARHSLIWRFRTPWTVQVSGDARRLDLLGASCLMLIRTAIALSPAERQIVAPRMRELADVLTMLATDLGDRQVIQDAVNSAAGIAHHLILEETSMGLTMAAAVASVRMAAYDIMLFGGANVEDAQTALREGADELRIVDTPERPPIPPVSARVPRFTRRRRRRDD